MNNKDRIILKKVLNEINIIEALIDGFYLEIFISDERTKRAVCMTLINIGELVKNLNDELRMQNKDIPWREISGMRDIAAHKYQTLKIERVWNTAKKDIPNFKEHILSILNQ